MGTQYDRGSITIGNALHASTAHLALLPPDYPGKSTRGNIEEAIAVDLGLGITREPAARGTEQGTLHPASHQQPAPVTTLGMNTRGDEGREGAVYTYARVFTWWAFTQRILDALEATLGKMEVGISCNDMPNPLAIPLGPVMNNSPPQNVNPQSTQDDANTKGPSSLLAGNAHQLSQYSSLPTNLVTSEQASNAASPVRAYHPLSTLPSPVASRMLRALAVALLGQWGTTGAAILIAYHTPMVGLGCRSGSYLPYGLLGTAVLGFLVVSMVLSHIAMGRYRGMGGFHPAYIVQFPL